MRQSQNVLVLLFSFIFGVSSLALEGLANLEKTLLEKNQEYLSLRAQTEAHEALLIAANSEFYPTLNAVGGYGQNRTDELAATEKGYVGYLTGKLNLFNGFKDQLIKKERKLVLQQSKLELESRKRELRLQLTEVVSNMVRLHKLQAILEEEYKITKTQKQMAAKKVSAGLTGNVDNLEFELKESEIQIEQKQIEQKHLEVHQIFVKLFGEDIDDSKLSMLDFSKPEYLIKNVNDVNIKETTEYQKADLIATRTEIEKKIIRAQFLPSLDFTYSAGRLTPSEESPIKFNESRYALLLTVPLFTGFDTYYKVKSASSMAQSAERNKQQKINDIQSEFNILKTKIIETNSLIKINEKRLINSQKYFELTLSEYKRGIKNSPDLVTATERLFSSKKRSFELIQDLELFSVKVENLSHSEN